MESEGQREKCSFNPHIPRIAMVPVNFQPGQGCNGIGSTLGLNNPQSSQFLASPEANISIEASDTCNGISISGKLKVVLHNHSLWLKFYGQQTEMILNKPGRRMFPFLVYKIHGMNPVAHYRVFLEIVPVDEYHWRFQDGRWSQCEKTENNMPGNLLYVHPDSPNTGAHWMNKEIKFEKLKMTNNKEATNSENKMILLQSFHKYQPRLGIEEVRYGKHETTSSSFTHSFTFPETEFIAVTAYQNAKLSQLKIKYNPFARGFRESYHSEESVTKCHSTANSTAMTTTSPETVSGGSSLELGEGSCQAKERAPLSPGLLGQASQPLQQGCTYDSTRSSSNLLSLGIGGMEHGFLPFTSPPTTHHNPREDVVVPQGDWCPSSSSNFTKNSRGWLQSVPSVSMDTVTRAEEEMQLEGEPWTYALTSHSNDSGLGEEVSKKRALSPDDSRDEMCPGWKHGQQQARHLTSLEFCATMISTENASSGYTVGPGEGTCEIVDEMSLTPGFLPQLSKKPMDYACDSVHSSNNLQSLGMNGMNPGLSTSICSPTVPFGQRQDVMDPAGDCPTFSSADSNMNNGSWLHSVPPVPMYPLVGTQKEVDPDEELLTYASTLQSLDPGWYEENSESRTISQ